MTPDSEDFSVLDPIVSSDHNQYDSQELVVDYDDRSEVMRELELKYTIFPSQDLVLQSNDNSQLHQTLSHDCMYTSHSAPIFVPTILSPSHLQHNDDEEIEVDYDDRSEIMDALYRRTIVHHSQDLVVQPILRHDCMYTLQSAPILAPTISSSSHLQQNDNEKMEADNDDGSLNMGELYRSTRVRHSQDLVPHSGDSHHNGNRMDSNLGLLPGFDPANISDSQSIIRYRSNSAIEEDLDDSADTTTPDTLIAMIASRKQHNDIDAERTLQYESNSAKTVEFSNTTQMRQQKAKKQRVKQTNKQAQQKFNKRNHNND